MQNQLLLLALKLIVKQGPTLKQLKSCAHLLLLLLLLPPSSIKENNAKGDAGPADERNDTKNAN
jgi:hypothetical protein